MSTHFVPNADESEASYLKYEPRSWIWRVPFLNLTPTPPKGTVDDAELMPDVHASILSRWAISWIVPLVSKGYTRPLEPEDLYKLDDVRSADTWARRFLESYYKEAASVALYNAKVEWGEIQPSWFQRWKMREDKDGDMMKQWIERKRKKSNMARVMYDMVGSKFWLLFALQLVSDTSIMFTPLVIQKLIGYIRECYVARQQGEAVPSLERGIILAFVLFFLQLLAASTSILFWYEAGLTALLVRTGLTSAIYNRRLHLSPRASSLYPPSKLLTLISADVMRVYTFISMGMLLITSPFQIGVALVLLVRTLGALASFAGFAVFVLALFWPLPQLVTIAQRLRWDAVQWTEKRVGIIGEVLGQMRLVKYFTNVRGLKLIRAIADSVTWTLPALASVISIVIFASSNGQNTSPDPAITFTAIGLFSLLKLPLLLLPGSVGSWIDGLQALRRIEGVFTAETLDENSADEPAKTISLDFNPEVKIIEVNPDLDVGLRARNASFIWDAAPTNEEGAKVAGDAPASGMNTPSTGFQVRDLSLEVPRGDLVVIIGGVGAGKSSVLQGLIGDMRRTNGSIAFGGSVGYCAQTSWIQNASIRENITFGQPFVAEKYWSAIQASCLHPDLDLLPAGDTTIVGERGIQLSGGQRSRLSLCRALYSSPEVILLDDPLAALDAHVAKKVFDDVIVKGLRNKTRILVTHAVHFLSNAEVKHVYVMRGGTIVEHGSYEDLKDKENGELAALVKHLAPHAATNEEKETLAADTTTRARDTVEAAELAEAEERNVGSVGGIVVPVFIILVALQITTVMSSYWLVFWDSDRFKATQMFYMVIFASWAIGQSTLKFAFSGILSVFSTNAAATLHKNALTRILHAPMAYFDTTPFGRIMNRFSKDIDTIDNLLGDSIDLFFSTLSTLLTGIILISVVLPFFLIPGVFCLMLFFWGGLWYAPAAREIMRIEAILRSAMYATFSESLAGMTTIRAYGQTSRFRKHVNNRIDVQVRALWAFGATQGWLGLRLDAIGVFLTLAVALLLIRERFNIDSAHAGLALTYVLSLQQTIGFMVRQSVLVQTYLNSVERITYYSNDVVQEAEYHIPETKPPASWPEKGAIELKDVVMAYRPGLEPTLKGLTLSVKAGEKVGIVGRTGAGKSSLMAALYRLAELSEGSIEIDEIDVAKVGLTDLRSQIAIIPQEPLLFTGTLRTNLDPFGLYDDVILWDALRRSHLLSEEPAGSNTVVQVEASESGLEEIATTPSYTFTLDSPIDADGANLSVGQRSLVSLARALVKNSKILVLDEATASVDYATDRKIQDTIAHEFQDRTILCIAHRLQTIIAYNRIVVMDAGRIAELGTPLELLESEAGVFRSMCERSRITHQNIREAGKLVDKI